jgi:Raf kinase inhibitor-like YbhB/YbcL family protein
MPNTVPVRAPDAAKNGSSLRVTSESFSDGGDIPMENVFTGCGAPDGTKSYAITCFDPDAPTGSGYWHWILANLPASVTSLAAGDGNSDSPKGAQGGYSDFGMHSYGGPCPPKGHGKHHYTFTVYALDVDKIDGASGGTTGATLVFMMRGHVLATGQITGTFGH